MSNDNTSIHEFDLNIICDYFSHVERQGPGSPDITIKALSFVDNLNDESQIVDLGCGTGGQTMILAKNAPGRITGLDFFQKFIDIFNKNAVIENLADRVKGIQGSMHDLPFEKQSLDLIWSEGAIYNIGFERGLKEWREYLKPGGYVAVTEASWFKPGRPAEINDFWENAYPDIDTIPTKLAQLESAGYLPVASFILPETCWTENFFDPQVKAREIFLKKYEGKESAEAFADYMINEARLYEKYKEFYGYAFYIGRKI